MLQDNWLSRLPLQARRQPGKVKLANRPQGPIPQGPICRLRRGVIWKWRLPS